MFERKSEKEIWAWRILVEKSLDKSRGVCDTTMATVILRERSSGTLTTEEWKAEQQLEQQHTMNQFLSIRRLDGNIKYP
ncbi:hypothetical protein KDH_54380 [Dictyobacter sp. S3.2.2.5]|uniref:Uncharacterized protein n=1 Tax=Dictyobacter halimunensis TaxID=3026934 RepID=A0ABQ6FWH5_9CHLR|nr:hypothetical protein KDH_54380 [Dictyobacter sp. S3.2.2.5]